MSRDYKVKPEEAALVIKPDGTVLAIFPEDGPLEIEELDHPSLWLMLTMTFLNDTDLQRKALQKLVEERKITVPEWIFESIKN